MLTAALTALVLGIFAGLAPGPYTTMVAATAFERGFRAAVPLAAAPLFTDLLPLILTSLILTTLSPMALSTLAVIGGIAVVGIGVMLLVKYHGQAAVLDEPYDAPPTVRLWHVVASTSISPAPWLFWLGIASPLFLQFWSRDWRQGAIFLFLIFGTNIGSALTLAWLASHGGRVLDPRWRQRVLRIAGVALIVAGGFLLVQAAQGDVASITDSQETFRSWLADLTSD